jgi:hypothetical protein
MKHNFFLLLFSGLLIISFKAWSHPVPGKEKGKKYPSFYKSHIIIDGRANEWADSLFFLNPDAKISYAAVNDSTNLCLCLKVFDDNQQIKLLRGGMEVWIDPSGRKKEVCGIRFPLSTTLKPGGRTGMNPADPAAIKQAKLMYILQAKDMELTGFKDEINGLVSNFVNRTGVQTVIKLDSTNILIYEARIPLSAFKTDLKRSEPLSVGFIIKGLERPKTQNGEDSSGSGIENHEGGGGYGNGERGGHEGGHIRREAATPESRQMIFEDTPMWLKFSFAH